MVSSASSSSQHDAEDSRNSSPVAFTAVTIDGIFWGPRLRTVREKTIPTMYEQMQKSSYFDVSQRNWNAAMYPVPYVFWETDITKWLEAASYSFATQPDPALDAIMDTAIEFMLSLQQEDGYLNLWFTEIQPDKRWSNIRDFHELYCAGHLIEAAVAHFQATGKRSLLDAVCRYADYIDTVFGTEAGKRRGYPGHEEIELALIKLYRVTGEERYLRLSHYFIEERGQQPHYFDAEARARGEDPTDFWAKTYEYNQSHQPVREQHEVVGHAVREMYLLSAVADLARELPDPSLHKSAERLWQHLTTKRLYVTGGIGSSTTNEGFTSDYDLPNLTAYAETCAAIGLILWNHRMLQLDVDRRYADLMERALYNGVLSGISQDGTSFFYVNPLESHGDHHRQGWYNCACCPPNLARLLMSLGQYVYSTHDADIFIHLYLESSGNIQIGSQDVALKQETAYPWDGTVRITVSLQEAAEFGIHLRIPGWCREAQLTVNGTAIALAEQTHKGYTRITRQWQNGDTIELTLAMPIERIYAHPAVAADSNRVALQRGPIVYCLESADNAVPLNALRLPATSSLESVFEPTILGGVTLLKGEALTLATDIWTDGLYHNQPPVCHPHRLVAIPYYAWDHRQPGQMLVWIQEA